MVNAYETAEPTIERPGPIAVLPARELRPFYLIVVFWGERFRDYFVDYCLPALLAPGNIPSLINGRKNKFLICTTPEDWTAIEDLPIFKLLETHITPVMIEIPPAPPEKSGCEHMGVGHKLATELAHRDKAFGVLLTPDLILSDGALAAVQGHALAGKEVVLCPASLRIMEEPFFAGLARISGAPTNARLSQLGRALTVTARQMVALCLCSRHSTAHLYEWNTPYFADFPVACYWLVPGEDGLLMHSLSWTPLLLDYAIVGDHATKALESWTIDGDYLHSNFYNAENVHIVRDSDELMCLSWSPSWDRPIELRPEKAKSRWLLGDLYKRGCLRRAFFSSTYDDLKRDLFFLPIYWHARDLSATWRPVAFRAKRLIRESTYGTRPGPWARLAGADSTSRADPLPEQIRGKFTYGTAVALQWTQRVQTRVVERFAVPVLGWLSKVAGRVVAGKQHVQRGGRAIRLCVRAALGDSAARLRLSRHANLVVRRLWSREDAA